MNKNIDRIIKATKGMFTSIAIEYLRQTVKNEHREMIKPNRMKESQYSVKDIKKVIAQKKGVINSLNGSPSKYTDLLGKYCISDLFIS